MTAVPQAYLDHLEAITGPDPSTVRACWEPDGVLEFPYSASIGTPQRNEGIDAIVGYFDGLGLFTAFTFTDMRAWRVEGTDEYVLEMHGSSTVRATGTPYEQDYLVRFGLAPSGKLEWMREFWDPTRLSLDPPASS